MKEPLDDRMEKIIRKLKTIDDPEHTAKMVRYWMEKDRTSPILVTGLVGVDDTLIPVGETLFSFQGNYKISDVFRNSSCFDKYPVLEDINNDVPNKKWNSNTRIAIQMLGTLERSCLYLKSNSLNMDFHKYFLPDVRKHLLSNARDFEADLIHIKLDDVMVGRFSPNLKVFLNRYCSSSENKMPVNIQGPAVFYQRQLNTVLRGGK